MFAAVSHLPHLLAYALVGDIAARADAAQLFGYAAGGFRDFTRIASSHPEMWRDICVANGDRLLQELSLYEKKLKEVGDMLQSEGCCRAGKTLRRRARGARALAERRIPSEASGPGADRAAPTGTVRLPGSKSISNRVLLLAALAKGATHGARACWTPTTRA